MVAAVKGGISKVVDAEGRLPDNEGTRGADEFSTRLDEFDPAGQGRQCRYTYSTR